MSDDFWGEPIYSYSREQAIADGVLVDVTIMAREAGIVYSTAVTRRVWDELVVPDEDSRKEGQCEPGRMWDILWMLRMTIQGGESGSEVRFPVIFVAAGNRRTTMTLKAVCAYGGASVLQKLPENLHLISHVHPKGALYEPAPQDQSGQRGRNRKKGKRLSGMAEWANNRQPWETLVFDQFGFHATVKVKTIQALYYTAGKDRLLTIVLVRDVRGKRPDQMFYSTCLDWDARQILSTYAARWAIEVTFENGKQLLGFEDPANRKEKAVRRTAPMALMLYSLIIVWFHEEGHRHLKFPDRPWYRQKQEPSFADMLTTLRRQSVEEILRDHLPKSRRLKKKVLQILHILCLAG